MLYVGKLFTRIHSLLLTYAAASVVMQTRQNTWPVPTVHSIALLHWEKTSVFTVTSVSAIGEESKPYLTTDVTFDRWRWYRYTNLKYHLLDQIGSRGSDVSNTCTRIKYLYRLVYLLYSLGILCGDVLTDWHVLNTRVKQYIIVYLYCRGVELLKNWILISENWCRSCQCELKGTNCYYCCKIVLNDLW